MRLSPPITILALVAVGVAGVSWLMPPPREPASVAVQISIATHQKLAAWAKAHPGPTDQPMTVAQAIDVLADGPATAAAVGKD